MAKIQVLKVPSGTAPLTMRKCLVGLVFTSATGEEIEARPVTGFGANPHALRYFVPRARVASALRNTHQEEAAKFYEGLACDYVAFHKTACQEV